MMLIPENAPFSSQTCRAALKKHTGALRLLAAMYECRVQTPEQALGKVQAVLAQKLAKVGLFLLQLFINFKLKFNFQVHSEEVNELSGLFEICAHLPVVESFSFCEQLRKRSSGTASAQLEFAGWEIIDEDPFWEPSTEEEVNKAKAKDYSMLYANALLTYTDGRVREGRSHSAAEPSTPVHGRRPPPQGLAHRRCACGLCGEAEEFEAKQMK
jgi:translation elongation factor EF-G